MTVYFAGNTLASFQRDLVSVTESTSGGTFESAFVDRSILLVDAASRLQSPVFGPVSGTVWLRFDVYTSSSTSGVDGVVLRNGANGVFRLTPNYGNWIPQYSNGTAWVNTGASYAWPTSSRVTIVIRIDLNSGFQMWAGGVLVSSGSGWAGGPTQVDNFRLTVMGAATYYSQIIVADFDLRDAKYRTLNLTGDSAANNGQASGTFADLQETGVNDATVVNIATAGNKAGQTKESLSVPSGYQIVALAQAARVRATAPMTDAKLGVRSGGTNYSSAGVGASGMYAPATRIDHVDPATSAGWTESGVNSAEIYQEAV